MQCVTRSALITTKDILRLKPKSCRILDASWHLPNTGRIAAKEYLEAHIPGALFFDIDDCADKTADTAHMLPKPEDFERYVGHLGINNDTHVIVYDNNDNFPIFSAQRVWWTFRIFGHENISILEGGLPKWIAEGGELTKDIISVNDEKFMVNFRQNLVKAIGEVEKNIGSGDFQLVDARPAKRFEGLAPEPRSDIKSGCIPKSSNIPFMDTLNLEPRTFKSPEDLKAIFANVGVDLNKPVTATCGSGISACLVALAAYELGKEDVAIYDGSWVEWYMKAPGDLKENVPTD